MLRNWLPITSILFLIETIQRYQFRRNYLKHKKKFFNLRTLKAWSDKCLKSPVLEDPSISNIVNMPKHCWNQHQRTFSILIDHCQVNWVGKNLSYWHVKSWAADQMYPVLNRDNLVMPIQMQLSQKKKHFLNFLLHFWNVD